MTESAKNNFLSVFAFAILGAIILICTNGMTFSGITVFDETLIEAFSWSKSELKLRDFINLGVTAMIIPFIGAFIDRFGVKKSFLFGLSLLAILFYSYSFIGSKSHMYIIHIGFAFAMAACGTLAVIIMVSQRTQKNRGTAIGIALAGTSMGGLLIPKLGRALLENHGWRDAMKYEAILPLILIAIVVFFIKDSDRFKKDGKSKTDDLVEIKIRDAIKTKQFWLLAIIGFFCYYGILGAIGNLFLYMRELEFSADTAVNALGLISILILGAKLLSGVLTDYINKYLLFKIQIFIMLLGSIGFALYDTSIIWIAIPIFALGWGGLYTLINYIIITTFGVNSAGKIAGSISTFECFGSGLGIWMSGLIADKTGSYAMSFTVVAVFLFVSFILSLFINPVTIKDEN